MSFAFPHRGAEFTGAGKEFRLWLTRTWDRVSQPRLVTFIGLNPSKADATTDDPTIRKEIGFGKKLGCTGLIKVNLVTRVETDSRKLKTNDPHTLGPSTLMALRAARKAIATDGKVFLVWGNLPGRQMDVLARFYINMLEANSIPLWCLGITKQGQPKHTCRLGYTADPQRYHLPETRGV